MHQHRLVLIIQDELIHLELMRVSSTDKMISSAYTLLVNTRSVTFDKKQQQYLPKANNKTTLPIRRSGSYGNLSTKNIADKKM
jgi:hypothetical protein